MTDTASGTSTFSNLFEKDDYDPKLNAIIISPNAELKGGPDAKLDIEYLPIDPRQVKRGRAKRMK